MFVKSKNTELSQKPEQKRVIVPRLEKREIELGIGSRLLQKMGWQPGSGLGKDESGPIRPIVVEQRAKDIGLGFSEQRKEKKEKKNKKNVPPPPLEVTCEECGEVVVGRKLIKEHKAMHRKNKRAKTEENEDSEDVEKEDICFICGEVLKGDEIKRHRTQHPKTNGVLECAICGETVQGAVEINKHKQKHRLDLKKRPKEDVDEKKEEGEVSSVRSKQQKAFVAPRRMN